MLDTQYLEALTVLELDHLMSKTSDKDQCLLIYQIQREKMQQGNALETSSALMQF